MKLKLLLKMLSNEIAFDLDVTMSRTITNKPFSGSPAGS